MKQKSSYVFGAAVASMALGGVSALLEKAYAGPITNANFSFESLSITSTNSTGTVASQTAASVGPFAAESGTGSAFGVHTSTATVYSTPAGNGSPKSFSSNTWAIGDYYQFSVPTTGIQNILVSFDQGASSTGPHAFSFAYSIDGTNFSTLTSYNVLSTVSATNSTTSSTTVTTNFGGTGDTRFNLSFDLSSITGLNNDPNAVFRLVDGVTAAVAGTNRVDNFIVSGDAVPEPAALSLLTVASVGALLRRRARS